MIYLVVIALGLLTIHIYIRYGRMGRLVNKIPGPWPLPFIGNLLLLNVPSDSVFNVIRDLAKNYGPIVKVWFFTNALIGIRHPDDLEVLLSNQRAIQKSYIYGFLEPWLKTGLLTSTGEKWRSRRKILTPTFHFEVLRKYMDITSEQTDRLIYEIRKEGNKTVQSLLPLCSTITLNIICESAMGVALDQMDPEMINKYKTAIHDMGDIVVQRSVKPYIFDWLMCPIIKLGRQQKHALKILHEFTSNVLRERREYHERIKNQYRKEFDNDDESTIDEKRKRLAMLDILLLAERNGHIDEEGIKEELDTFTFEGHDTTAMGLVFILMLLAENKEAQEKARTEARRVFESSNGKMRFAELAELAYIERCVKEGLRLFPSVPTILRHLTEDLKLKNYILPAGTDVSCLIYDLHRDPDFWPDPLKFDPDRFLPHLNAARHPFAYLPFSAGPRNCIGQKFAMNELKTVLSRILCNFYLEPVHRTSDVKFTADLVMRPAHPVYVKFIRIDAP